MHPSGGQLYCTFCLCRATPAACIRTHQEGLFSISTDCKDERIRGRRLACGFQAARPGALLPWSSVQTTTAASAPASSQTRRVKCSQGTRALCHKEQVSEHGPPQLPGPKSTGHFRPASGRHSLTRLPNP